MELCISLTNADSDRSDWRFRTTTAHFICLFDRRLHRFGFGQVTPYHG